MKNFYEKSDMLYPEKIVAMEDFEYGTMVKCTIPVLFPFINTNIVENKSEKLFKGKLDNKDLNMININRYNSCNYIELFIPRGLSRNIEHKGRKGEEFVGIFIGGDINKCSIIGRYDE